MQASVLDNSGLDNLMGHPVRTPVEICSSLMAVLDVAPRVKLSAFAVDSGASLLSEVLRTHPEVVDKMLAAMDAGTPPNCLHEMLPCGDEQSMARRIEDLLDMLWLGRKQLQLVGASHHG